MAIPRRKYVREGQEGVYHCFSRCVRRAFLYGFDPLTRRDFSHRKAWILERLRCFSSIFAIEVCAYAIMSNHYHVVLRIRPDIAAGWSDRDVAIRWLKLFPKNHGRGSTSTSPREEDISKLVCWPERIAVLRRRLCSLSWLMGRLNEFVARAANKEDSVKGRFWESRFRCQALLDEAAMLACMIYVDLNPIRAGLAATPEESDFTSLQERIRAWQNDRKATSSLPTFISGKDTQGSVFTSFRGPKAVGENTYPAPEGVSALNSYDANWLCPIFSDGHRRGILNVTTAEYFDLADESGRLIRSGKRGTIPPNLAPILLRISVRHEAWLDTVSRFESKFHLASGSPPHLRNFARAIGSRWLQGIAAARAVFAS